MRILLDIDNVLADFSGGACRALSKILQREVSPTEFTDFSIEKSLKLTTRQLDAFNRAVGSKGFCLDLQPCLDSGLVITRLFSCKNVDTIKILTTPWPSSRYWHYERLEWIKEHVGLSEAAVIFVGDKSLIRGDISIDDSLHQLRGPRKLKILWKAPHNVTATKGFDVRTNSWQTVLDLIKGLKQ